MTLYNDFQEVLHDMDRQMSTIILRAFDDCVTLESCFKVLNCRRKPLVFYFNSYKMSAVI